MRRVGFGVLRRWDVGCAGRMDWMDEERVSNPLTSNLPLHF